MAQKARIHWANLLVHFAIAKKTYTSSSNVWLQNNKGGNANTGIKCYMLLQVTCTVTYSWYMVCGNILFLRNFSPLPFCLPLLFVCETLTKFSFHIINVFTKLVAEFHLQVCEWNNHGSWCKELEHVNKDMTNFYIRPVKLFFTELPWVGF